MNKILRRISVGFFIVGMIAIIVMLLPTFAGFSFDSTYINADMTGVYSVDDKDYEDFDSDNFNIKDVNKINIKAKLNNPDGEYLIFRAMDVWVNVVVEGELVATNRTKASSKPGYSFIYVPISKIKDKTMDITIDSPYSSIVNTSNAEYAIKNAIVGDKADMYIILLEKCSFPVFIGLAIIFIGIIGFGFSSTLFIDRDKRNNSLVVFTIISGFTIAAGSLSNFFPLWTSNAGFCEFFSEMMVYILMVSFDFYMASIMVKPKTSIVLSINLIIGVLLTIVVGVSAFFNVYDILNSYLFTYPLFLIKTMVIVVCLFIESFRYKSNISKTTLVSVLVFIFVAILEIFNNYLGLVEPGNLLYVGIFIAIVLQVIFFLKITREHYKEVLEVEKMHKELLESRVAIMVSQIQPHFLYNSLTSIAVLCTKDPKLAKKTTIEFADYLRVNMNSLKEKNPVTFSRELEHLKTYLKLEKMRFGDELNVEYNIEVTDFLVPALAIQPLVENAVKHGVGMKEDGGTVTISTMEDEKAYYIVVEDDGVGFDTTVTKADGRSHVGMDNCRERLKTMCNGSVNIESTIGLGTKATITLPKEK